MLTDEHYMRAALREAQRAFDEEEVPIGAVIECEGLIIGKGYNQVERLKDPTAHAEILAITAATQYLNSKYLKDCTLYVTVEPCVMCAGALRWAQLARVVFGAAEPKTGFSRVSQEILHPKTLLSSGVMEFECAQLMQDFFRRKRK
ncbi:MAG: nucleoside deaminase [Bacteroidota bacterium]